MVASKECPARAARSLSRSPRSRVTDSGKSLGVIPRLKTLTSCPWCHADHAIERPTNDVPPMMSIFMWPPSGLTLAADIVAHEPQNVDRYLQIILGDLAFDVAIELLQTSNDGFGVGVAFARQVDVAASRVTGIGDQGGVPAVDESEHGLARGQPRSVREFRE